MNYRTTILNIKEKEFHGEISVYPNHSTISPGYICRSGPPFENCSRGVFIGNRPHRFCMELTEDLKLKDIRIYRYTISGEVPHEIKEKIVNKIRKGIGKFIGRKTANIKIPKQTDTKVKRFNRL